jgi:hypothetical protein
VEYVFSSLPTVFRCDDQSADFVTVYLEQKFGVDDFEPDLFPVEVTEKEWKPNADRASIYKAPLPEFLRSNYP